MVAGDPHELGKEALAVAQELASADSALAGVLRDLAAEPGAERSVLVATHDVEFTALVADDLVVLAEGEVVSAGPAATVIAESPSFAPQVTKILGSPWLRVSDAVAAVSAPAAGPTSQGAS